MVTSFTKARRNSILDFHDSIPVFHDGRQLDSFHRECEGLGLE